MSLKGWRKIASWVIIKPLVFFFSHFCLMLNINQFKLRQERCHGMKREGGVHLDHFTYSTRFSYVYIYIHPLTKLSLQYPPSCSPPTKLSCLTCNPLTNLLMRHWKWKNKRKEFSSITNTMMFYSHLLVIAEWWRVENGYVEVINIWWKCIQI